jgi:hypothetical protein
MDKSSIEVQRWGNARCLSTALDMAQPRTFTITGRQGGGRSHVPAGATRKGESNQARKLCYLCSCTQYHVGLSVPLRSPAPGRGCQSLVLESLLGYKIVVGNGHPECQKLRSDLASLDAERKKVGPPRAELSAQKKKLNPLLNGIGSFANLG